MIAPQIPTYDQTKGIVDPTLGELIAIDQSLRCPGVAVFHQGVLTASVALAQKSDTSLPVAQRAFNVAAAVTGWLADKVERPTTLVIEWPQVYRATRSKGDPNDLLGVAGVGAAIAGILGAICYRNGSGHCLRILSPTPAEWAGQLPKATQSRLASDSPRAQRILSRLSDQEKEVASRKHDALDAIGIGLYVLGRFDRIRVFSNGEQ